MEVRESALGSVAAVAALDVARLRELDSAVVRDLPDLRVDLRIARRYLQRATAPEPDRRAGGARPAPAPRVRRHLRPPRPRRRARRTARQHLQRRGRQRLRRGRSAGAGGGLQPARGPARRARCCSWCRAARRRGSGAAPIGCATPRCRWATWWRDLNMDLIGRNWVDSVIVSRPGDVHPGRDAAAGDRGAPGAAHGAGRRIGGRRSGSSTAPTTTISPARGCRCSSSPAAPTPTITSPATRPTGSTRRRRRGWSATSSTSPPRWRTSPSGLGGIPGSHDRLLEER